MLMKASRSFGDAPLAGFAAPNFIPDTRASAVELTLDQLEGRSGALRNHLRRGREQAGVRGVRIGDAGELRVITAVPFSVIGMAPGSTRPWNVSEFV